MKFKSDIEVQAGIKDKDGQTGSNGQILASTGSQVDWIDQDAIISAASKLVVIACKNTSGATITKGTPVYQTGTVGATDVIEVAEADASDEDKMAAIGLLQTDIDNNDFGNVVITGELLNFTTSPIDGVTPTTGDTIYVKPGGGLTLTKPTGVNFIQNVGLVGKVSGGNAGSITVSSIMRSNDVPTPLYIDHDNQRLGIGTPTPGSVLDVQGTQGQLFSVTDDLSGEIFAVSDISGVPIMTVNSSGLSTFAGNVSITKGVLSITSDGLNAVTFTESGSGDFTIDAPDDIRLDAGGGDIVLKSAGTEYGRISKSSSDLSITSSATDSDILINPSGNGNVGIGTTSPGAKLEVVGNTTITGAAGTTLKIEAKNDTAFNDPRIEFVTWNVASGASSGRIQLTNGTFNSNDMAFFTETGNSVTEKMRIDSDGNVGIGTTSPGSRLTVSGTNNATSEITLINTNPSTDNDWSITPFYNDQTLRFRTNSAATTVMTLKDNGNVGIGTTSPAKQLVVRSSAPWIRIEEDSASNKRLDLWVDPTSAIGYIGANQSAQQLSFQTSSSDRIRILNNGNVGIGVTGPVAPLDVFGAAVQNGSTPGIKLSSSNTQQTVFAIGNTGTRQYELAVGGTTSSVPGAFYIYDNNAADFRITLATSGNVGIGTTSPQSLLHLTHANPILLLEEIDQIADAKRWGIQSETSILKFRAFNDALTTAVDVVSMTRTGNVGIGTTSPSYKLTSYSSGDEFAIVAGAGNAVGEFTGIGLSGYIATNAAVKAGLVFERETSWGIGKMHFLNNNTLGDSDATLSDSKMTIDSDGNVGIGTTSPSQKLEVAGSVAVTGTNVTVANASNPYIYINDTNAGAGIFQQEGNTTRIGSDSNTQVVLVQNNATAVTIDTSKNVGINTTSPGDKLHVEGGIIIQNGNNLQWGGLYSAGAPTIYASTNYLHFVPTGSSGSGYRQMRLDTTGLGIGTSSPSEKLDVAGNIKIQAALLSNQENTDIDTGAEVVAQVAHATYTAAFFDFVVKKGTNVRSGTVYACHDGDTTPLVEFTETSTNDLGDTSDVTLSVDISGANMRLLATVTSDDWSVKSLIRAI